MIGEHSNETEEEEVLEEEEESGENVETTAPTPSGSDHVFEDLPVSKADIALARLWPMRYLGIHCAVEDVLQFDDRAIYPRASSRLGPRHQAHVGSWPGRPLKLVKPPAVIKKNAKGGNKMGPKPSKEALAALEEWKKQKSKRPPWVVDEPLGYEHRGEDHPNGDPKNTAKLLFKMPEVGESSERGLDESPKMSAADIGAYMKEAKELAKVVHVRDFSTNFLDKCLQLLQENDYDKDAALKQVAKLDKKEDLHEPRLTKEELKRFEEGVAKYGSELRNVRLHVKTLSHGEIVRFYYMWKKTASGKKIWGSYGGRKGKSKRAEQDPAAKLLDDIAHDQDDSAFDNEKAAQKKRGFQCKFCHTKHSPQWRRAPGVSPGQTVPVDGKKGKEAALVLALCQRCAGLWRRYAIIWENYEEVAKKVTVGGVKASKKRIDEELLHELIAANEAATSGEEYPPVGEPIGTAQSEPPRKKQKLSIADKDSAGSASDAGVKKKQQSSQPPQHTTPAVPPPPPKPPTPPPPIIPNEPKMRVLPCAICQLTDVDTDMLMHCKDCRLTVHRKCYGIESPRMDKWTCDMCKNDKKPAVSCVSIMNMHLWLSSSLT
jgi:hypothetical protein